MTDDERKIAETEISSEWLDDASKSPHAFLCSEDEVYRLALECAQLRGELAEIRRSAAACWNPEWFEVAPKLSALLFGNVPGVSTVEDAQDGTAEIPGVPFPEFPTIRKETP